MATADGCQETDDLEAGQGAAGVWCNKERAQGVLDASERERGSKEVIAGGTDELLLVVPGGPGGGLRRDAARWLRLAGGEERMGEGP